jgi:hypothetical protein
MRYIINGTIYNAHFSHMHEPGKRPRRITLCRIHEGDCNAKPCTCSAYIGATTCSRKDTFHGGEGNKIAFGRAVRALSRELRSLLWDASGLNRSMKKAAHV